MYKKILLTVDLNEDVSWKKALPTAVEFAKIFGAGLHVVTVLPDFGMPVVRGFFPDDFQEKAQTDVEDKLAAFCDEHIASETGAHSVVRFGNVYEEILKLADEIACDLIVIGAPRPELKDYLLGPNAARVVRHASCSVLVVRE
ncbi:MAG: universal stress protein UspA [Rhodospirillaceae bacterium]|jgi:nucleotide-binding universal stress UspA family protein|nr:universal stress protein UspA [Rhodospirillaceae bacterium]|tara:strand:+ start:264 stop:692 length:429 start_codon:yes stop_codon:yes gene_type:complete